MSLLMYPVFKAFSTAGAPLNGGKLYAYVPGTSTPKDTYSDRALSAANSVPVVLDANGEATVYLNGATKLILKTAADVTLWTMDYVGAPPLECSAAELNTGTERNEFVSPYAFLNSTYATRNIILKVISDITTLTTGDGKIRFVVPAELDGWIIKTVGAHVYTASTSGAPTVQIHNQTDAQDILSTPLTIDINETDSATAATPAVINTSYDDLATGDVIRIDCDVAGTGTAGLEIRLGLKKV